MERSTLEAMLEGATGVDRDGDNCTVTEGYRLTVYVGEPGQAMEVTEVVDLKLNDGFCEATSSEHNVVFFVEYSSLHGLSVRPPSGTAARRTGFS